MRTPVTSDLDFITQFKSGFAEAQKKAELDFAENNALPEAQTLRNAAQNPADAQNYLDHVNVLIVLLKAEPQLPEAIESQQQALMEFPTWRDSRQAFLDRKATRLMNDVDLSIPLSLLDHLKKLATFPIEINLAKPFFAWLADLAALEKALYDEMMADPVFARTYLNFYNDLPGRALTSFSSMMSFIVGRDLQMDRTLYGDLHLIHNLFDSALTFLGTLCDEKETEGFVETTRHLAQIAEHGTAGAISAITPTQWKILEEISALPSALEDLLDDLSECGTPMTIMSLASAGVAPPTSPTRDPETPVATPTESLELSIEQQAFVKSCRGLLYERPSVAILIHSLSSGAYSDQTLQRYTPIFTAVDLITEINRSMHTSDSLCHNLRMVTVIRHLDHDCENPTSQAICDKIRSNQVKRDLDVLADIGACDYGSIVDLSQAYDLSQCLSSLAFLYQHDASALLQIDRYAKTRADALNLTVLAEIEARLVTLLQKTFGTIQKMAQADSPTTRSHKKSADLRKEILIVADAYLAADARTNEEKIIDAGIALQVCKSLCDQFTSLSLLQSPLSKKANPLSAIQTICHSLHDLTGVIDREARFSSSLSAQLSQPCRALSESIMSHTKNPHVCQAMPRASLEAEPTRCLQAVLDCAVTHLHQNKLTALWTEYLLRSTSESLQARDPTLYHALQLWNVASRALSTPTPDLEQAFIALQEIASQEKNGAGFSSSPLLKALEEHPILKKATAWTPLQPSASPVAECSDTRPNINTSIRPRGMARLFSGDTLTPTSTRASISARSDLADTPYSAPAPLRGSSEWEPGVFGSPKKRQLDRPGRPEQMRLKGDDKAPTTPNLQGLSLASPPPLLWRAAIEPPQVSPPPPHSTPVVSPTFQNPLDVSHDVFPYSEGESPETTTPEADNPSPSKKRR